MMKTKYYKNEDKWYEVVWASQCESTIAGYRCQAKINHEGLCWSFRQDGTIMTYNKNTNSIKKVLPTDKNYPHPVNLYNMSYLHQRQDVQITDLKKIGELNLTKQKALTNG